MCLGIYSTSFHVLFKWMTSFVTLEIFIITLATTVWWKVCSAVRCTNEQEAGSRVYMMNEKSKSLEKPGVKSGGAKKKISLMWLRWKNGIVFIFFSQQMSGTACKGLEGKCAGKMQTSWKSINSSFPVFSSFMTLSSLIPCYFPLISQSFLWIKCNNPILTPPLCQAL